jgi:hypothetical protein
MLTGPHIVPLLERFCETPEGPVWVAPWAGDASDMECESMLSQLWGGGARRAFRLVARLWQALWQARRTTASAEDNPRPRGGSRRRSSECTGRRRMRGERAAKMVWGPKVLGSNPGSPTGNWNTLPADRAPIGSGHAHAFVGLFSLRWGAERPPGGGARRRRPCHSGRGGSRRAPWPSCCRGGVARARR